MTKVINNSFFLGINFYFCVETSSALGGLCVRQTAPTIRIDGAGAGTLVGNCRTEANIARAPDHWCWAKIVVGWFVEIVSFHQSSLLLTIFLSAGTFDTWWIMSNMYNQEINHSRQDYLKDLTHSLCSFLRLSWSRSSQTWRQRCRSWSRWRHPQSRPHSPPSSAPEWRIFAQGSALFPWRLNQFHCQIQERMSQFSNLIFFVPLAHLTHSSLKYFKRIITNIFINQNFFMPLDLIPSLTTYLYWDHMFLCHLCPP